MRGALAQRVASGPRLTVALSGGIDSVVLLHLVHRIAPALGAQVDALHVNHGISPNANDWQRFCASLCDALGVPLAYHRVTVPRAGARGLEAAARAARYRVFEAADTDWIVLAHHRDDQAETVLHNLLRGAGVRGAAAMPQARSLGEGRPGLLRPLLAASRAEIEAYAQEHGLAWVRDESNEDEAYARNFLRGDVLPRLNRRFPGASGALARAAERFGEAECLLEEIGAADLSAARRGNALAVEALACLSPVRAANLLRYWLRACGLAMPDAVVTQEVLRQALRAAPDRQVQIALGAGSLRRFAGALHLVAADPLPPPPERYWGGEPEIQWGAGRIMFGACTGEGVAAAALARAPVRLRPRSGGETMQLASRGRHRSLKNLFQENAVPPWQRAAMPLLWCGDDVVWVPGVGVAAPYRCPAGESGWLPRWESAVPTSAVVVPE